MAGRLRDSRVEEKEDLQGLNDRLETYVAHVRSLRAAVDAKDRELHDALKSWAVERAKAAEALERVTVEATAARGRIATLESELKTEKAENSRLAAAARASEAELQQLRPRHAAMKAELEALTENREREARAARDTLSAKVAEVRGLWDQHHKENLEQLESELRAEYAMEIEELTRAAAQMEEAVDRLREEAAASNEEAAKSHAYANDLLARISSLEAAHAAAQEGLEAEKAELERQLLVAIGERNGKMEEFNRLMDVKISLQAEIAHYRKILEEEEGRTGLPTPPRKRRSTGGGGALDAGGAEEVVGEEVSTRAHATAVSRTAATSTRQSWSFFSLFGGSGGHDGVDDGREAAAEAAMATRSVGGDAGEEVSMTSPLPLAGKKRKHADMTPAATGASRSAAISTATTATSGGKQLRSSTRKTTPAGGGGGSAAANGARSASSRRKSAGGDATTAAATSPADEEGEEERVEDAHASGDGQTRSGRGRRGGRRRVAQAQDTAAPPALDEEAAVASEAGSGAYDGYGGAFESMYEEGEGESQMTGGGDSASVTSSSTRHSRRKRYPASLGSHTRQVGKLVTRSMEARGVVDEGRYNGADMGVSVDMETEKVVIQNRTAEDIDLDGWSLLSEVGEQRFIFPPGIKLAPGQATTVWSGRDAETKEHFPTDLVWTTRFIWNMTGDTAILYDADGHEVSRVAGHPVKDHGKKENGSGNECLVM